MTSTLLKDVVAFVEVRGNNDNRSAAICRELEQLGASVESSFSDQVTHVLFKEGMRRTVNRAKKRNVPLVSVTWLESCKTNQRLMPEKDFAAIIPDESLNSPVPRLNPHRRWRKQKSMQPNDYEEELARSAERSVKRRRRVEEANRFKLLDSTPSSTSSSPLVLVPETQGRSPFLLDLATRSPSLATVADTPITPTMKERIEKMRRERNGQGSEDQSPKATGRTNMIQKRLLEKLAKDIFSTEDSDEDDDNGETTARVVAKLIGGLESQEDEVVESPRKRRKRMPSKENSNNSKDSITPIKILGGKANGSKDTNAHCSNNQTVKENGVHSKDLKSPCSKTIKEKGGTNFKSSIIPGKTIRENGNSESRASIKSSRRSQNSSRDSITPPGKAVHQTSKPSSKSSKKPQPCLVMTSLHREEQDVVLSVVKKLGVYRVTEHVDDKTTHLVCGETRRTLNLLQAICRGCWIVSKQWVLESLEAERWLPEERYEMVEEFPVIKNTRCDNAETNAQCPQARLFSKCGPIFVAKTCVPPRKELVALLALCSGSVTNSQQRASVYVDSEYCQDRRAVKPVWILDSIMKMEVQETENYLLEGPVITQREGSPEF